MEATTMNLDRNPTSLALALTATLALACASTTPRPHLLAAASPTTDVPRADVAPLPPSAGARASEEVLRDPAQRMIFLERMRVQILQKTRAVAPLDYQARVRPSLDRQLRAMGIEPADVARILEDVDRTRARAGLSPDRPGAPAGRS
jgi:hypothetical protein